MTQQQQDVQALRDAQADLEVAERKIQQNFPAFRLESLAKVRAMADRIQSEVTA